MHRLVATVRTDEPATATAAIRGLPDVGLCEVRLDAFWSGPPEPDAATDLLMQLLDAGQARGIPLVATLRPERQGGAWTGDEKVRLDLLVAAAKAGFPWIDLEHDLEDPTPWLHALREAGAQVVLSEHLPATPSRDVGLLHLLAMQDRRVALDKLAFPVVSFADALRALELAHAHAARHGHPAIAPVGQGPALRALLRLAGNQATYGHAPGTEAAVAGQPGSDAVRAVWDHWGLDDGGVDDQDAGHAAHAGHAADAAHAADAGHAAWYAVLGQPTAHSLSPRIHNTAFAAAGRPERYGALDVPDSPGAFRLVATVAPRIGLAGASVTHPHKRHAHDVARRDATAEAVGAVNCLRFAADGAEGTNTDALAFQRLFRRHEDATGRIGVLGAGGASRAALWAAQDLGIEAVVFSRTDAGADVAARFGAMWRPWDERGDARPDVWVQATPLQDGVFGRGALDHRPAVVELVYGAQPTALEREAGAAGCPLVTGRDFLLEQAVDAFRFWTGKAPDRKTMARALEAA